MKKTITTIFLLFSFISSIFGIFPMTYQYLIKDFILFEITKDDAPLSDIDLKTDSGEDISKLSTITLKFSNKGDEALDENLFSEHNPFRINLNNNQVIDKKIKFQKGNSLIDEKQVYFNQEKNTIEFKPFILEKGKFFTVSFITIKKENYNDIKIEGQIKGIEPTFGIKEDKFNKLLNNYSFIIIFLFLSIFIGIPFALLLFLSNFLSIHFLRSNVFYIIKIKDHPKTSPILKTYINDILQSKYSVKIFATEYIKYMFDNKIYFYSKDLLNLFIIHKHFFDDIDINSKLYIQALNNKIINSSNHVDKDIYNFLDKIYSLNIFNKLRNMFDYIFEYRNINKENKNILNNSDKIFLGRNNDSNQ